MSFSYYEKVGKSITCIDDEIPFEVPDGWQFVRLKELWELLSGRDLLPNEHNDKSKGIPYITGASNFANGIITIARWTEHPQVIAEKGDLLITCKGTVGEIAYNTLEQAHIARQIMAIRNLYHLNIEYLKICLEYNLERIKSSAKGLIPGISRDDVLNIILPIPSEHHQTCIVEQVQKVNMIVDAIEASLS